LMQMQVTRMQLGRAQQVGNFKIKRQRVSALGTISSKNTAGQLGLLRRGAAWSVDGGT